MILSPVLVYPEIYAVNKKVGDLSEIIYGVTEGSQGKLAKRSEASYPL